MAFPMRTLSNWELVRAHAKSQTIRSIVIVGVICSQHPHQIQLQPIDIYLVVASHLQQQHMTTIVKWILEKHISAVALG